MIALAKPSDDMPFEEALKELEGIVRRLETGEATLEQAIADYERGMQLKAHCQKRLDQARLKVDKIIQESDGSLSLTPFEEESR